MPTYLYKCPIHDEFEEEHSIKIKLDNCPKCEKDGLEPQKLARLICSDGIFILNGSGWARDNYS